jgi:flavodoxin
MKTATIEAMTGGVGAGSGLVIEAMAIPETGSSAEMISGNTQAIAERIAAILAERGIGTAVAR